MKTAFSFFIFFLWLASSHLFAQKSVHYYIEQAKKNSPLIHDKKNQDTINQLEIDRLKSVYLKPQAGINVNYLMAPIISRDNNRTSLILNPGNPTNYSGYDMSVSNGGQYQALLNITQPLFNKKRFQTFKEQSNIASKRNKNDIKLSVHDIEKVVTDQFILCTIDKKQVKYTQEIILLLKHQKEVLTKLINSGIYKKSDLTLLNIEVQNYLVQLSNAQANFQKNLLDLNILCGIDNDEIVELQKLNLEIKEPKTSSSFLEKYNLDSLSIENQQKQFELKYKPKVSLYANTGLNTSYFPTIPHRLGVGLGIRLSYNLWDGNQKKINRTKTKLRTESIKNYKNNFINNNNVRKSKINKQIAAYTEQIFIKEHQLKNYDALLNNYKQEMVSGQLSVINYIAVLKNKTTAQLNYTLLFSQKELLINAYNYWNW